MLLELLALLIICSIFIYRWATKNNDFFKKRNIVHDKPTFLLGSAKDATLRKKNLFHVLCDIYNRHDGIVYGAFDNTEPILMVRDPELIKQIMIKDFDHFVNRRSFFDDSDDNLLNNSLFMMKSEKWRHMRSTLSPAFTGSKMRQMFELILETVDEAMVYLREQQKSDKSARAGFEVDIKDFTTRLTNDIIASAAFGLKVNSFRDKENAFYVKAKMATTITAWQQFKLAIIVLMPKIAQYFRVDIFDKAYTDYFMSLVLDAMKYRQENNIHRPDMINLLMEARGMTATDTHKSHSTQWSDTDAVAQCFAFFVAGFETSSGAMSFAAHELMEYPEVQQKLFEEIQEINEQLNGQPVTYELLQKMSYMDMVVSEVLRKWPVTVHTDRTCSKDYVYQSPEGERIEIKMGELVRIPICAIHRDPKYYANPDVLDPKRFSDENKVHINSGTYMPFGLGPRNCIGNRLALLQVKAFLYYLLRDYRLEASPRTSVPLELDPSNMQLLPKNGFWLQFIPRK